MIKNKVVKLTVLLMTAFSVMIFSSAIVFAADINSYSENSDNTVSLMEYDKRTESNHTEREQKNMSRIILTAAGVSIVVTAFAVFSIWNSYKTNGQSEPYPYDDKAPLQITDSDDILVDTHVERKLIKRDDPPHEGGGRRGNSLPPPPPRRK